MSNFVYLRFDLTTDQATFGLSKFDVDQSIIADTCPPEPLCPETKYRSVDGSGNNLKRKDWGQAATAYQRIVPPVYNDGNQDTVITFEYDAMTKYYYRCVIMQSYCMGNPCNNIACAFCNLM